MTAQIIIEISRWNILHTIQTEILQLHQLRFTAGAVHRDIGRYTTTLVFKEFNKSIIGQRCHTIHTILIGNLCILIADIKL